MPAQTDKTQSKTTQNQRRIELKQKRKKWYLASFFLRKMLGTWYGPVGIQ